MGIFSFRKRSNFVSPPPLSVNKKLAYLIHQDRAEDLITRYVQALETEESATWCKCLWRIHPDDQGIKPGHCRECGGSPKNVAHQGLPEDFENGDTHHFRGIRKIKVDAHPLCAVHTKEGMVLGFLQWAVKHAGD